MVKSRTKKRKPKIRIRIPTAKGTIYFKDASKYHRHPKHKKKLTAEN